MLFGDNIYIRYRVGEILFDIACKALYPNGLEALQAANLNIEGGEKEYV